MKKLILILLFIPLMSFGQQTVIIADGKPSESLMQNSINDTNSAGRFYIGDGKYKIITVGKSSLVSIKKIRKKAIKDIVKFANEKNLDFKIIDEVIRDRRLNKFLGKVTIIIEAYNKNGSLAVNESDIEKNKAKAKKEILELKEYLDLGIITQDEFNKKAEPLKKILLGS